MKKFIKNMAIKCWFGNSMLRKGVTFGKDSYIREHAQIGGAIILH